MLRGLARVIEVPPGVNLDVVGAAPVQLGEQRLEPVGMLVVDRDGQGHR